MSKWMAWPWDHHWAPPLLTFSCAIGKKYRLRNVRHSSSQYLTTDTWMTRFSFSPWRTMSKNFSDISIPVIRTCHLLLSRNMMANWLSWTYWSPEGRGPFIHHCIESPPLVAYTPIMSHFCLNLISRD